MGRICPTEDGASVEDWFSISAVHLQNEPGFRNRSAEKTVLSVALRCEMCAMGEGLDFIRQRGEGKAKTWPKDQQLRAIGLKIEEGTQSAGCGRGRRSVAGK